MVSEESSGSSPEAELRLPTLPTLSSSPCRKTSSPSSPATLGSPSSQTHSTVDPLHWMARKARSWKGMKQCTVNAGNLEDDDGLTAHGTRRHEQQQFPLSSPLRSPHRNLLATPPRRTSPKYPYSPIVIDSSPEPGQPDLNELLRSTQPPSHPQSQVAATKASKKVKPTPRKVVVGASQASSQPFLNPFKKRKASTPDSDDIPSTHFQPMSKRPRLQKAHIGDIMFKLHRSRLAKQSRFFATLFDRKGKQVAENHDSQIELDDTEVTEPEVMDDGCPLYRVNRISPEDFEQLLTILDDFTDFTEEAPPFAVLASIIRATTALSFDKLRTWAVRILEHMWPDSLDGLYADSIPHAAAAVTLARQCNIPRVRKRAYYELLRAPEFGQGALDDGDEENANNPDQFSLADYRRLVKAREELAVAWVEAATKVPDLGCRYSVKSKTPQDAGSVPNAATAPPHAPGLACLSSNLSNADTEWVAAVHESGVFEQYLHDPILGLVELMDIDWAGAGWCTKCTSAWHAAWQKQKEKLWQNLDLWLKLTPLD